MRKKITESCEMCSVDVVNPTTIKVEGAILSVCNKCTSFGNLVKDKPRMPSNKPTVKKTSTTPRKFGTTTKAVSKPRHNKDEKTLIPDYGQEIRLARSKRKLTQEKLSSLTGISVALLKSIEAEKIRPTDNVIVKLEKELGIVLMESLDVEMEYQSKNDGKGLTVGDIVSIKRLEFD
ncbi:MAG: multiprotein bridging factor aMBF1 [Candidatus Heimdallarchaeota archaeon]|nr:multiprotein bridging factor aMBF1 [Candidatus Heimdallarchaeota archaeon]MDH5646258.1 multiprotein bridging factor aMBF1 [Candidatus Heimdallarchaeota archaeon]